MPAPNSALPSSLHLFILRLKAWQVFVIITCAIALVGYPLFLLGQRTLSWQMSFMDSPAFGISLYLCWGIWLDAVLAADRRILARRLSPLLLVALVGLSLWFKDSPYGMIIFLPAIAMIVWVLVPTAKAIHRIEGRKTTGVLVGLDTVAVGIFFPIGVWILQLRLNAALQDQDNQVSRDGNPLKA